MNIGIEAQRIFRTRKHGMDFVALELIRHLQQMDTSHHFHVFVNDGPDQCLTESSQLTIHRFGGSYPVWEQVKLPRLARDLGLDLLHCTSNTAPVRCPVPLVVTIHDIIYLETHPLRSKGYTPYQRFGNLYRRWVVRQLLQKVPLIYTVSEYEKRRFVDFLGIAPERVAVVYNGVGDHFQPTTDHHRLARLKQKYRLPDRFLLFLGNTDPKKNTQNTVVAFAKYCAQRGRSHHLVVGDLDPSVIRQYLREAGLENYLDQFHFTGYIDNRELPAILQMADLFLYPSKRESFGIPILEGMATGTPVITGNTASMPEVAGDAALLVDPFQPSAITAGIARVLNDSGLRDQLRARGLKRAQRFSWTQTAQTTLRTYEQLLSLSTIPQKNTVL